MSLSSISLCAELPSSGLTFPPVYFSPSPCLAASEVIIIIIVIVIKTIVAAAGVEQRHSTIDSGLVRAARQHDDVV